MADPAAARSTGPRRRWVWRAAVLAALVGVAAAGYGARWALGPLSPSSTGQTLVVVQRGMNVRQIALRLRQDRLIRSALAFRLLARGYRVAGELEAGTYAVSAAMRPATILQLMAHGRVTVRRVAIPEGWDAQQVARAIGAALPQGTGMRQVLTDTALLQAAGLPTPAGGVRDPMEGYLFPATYTFAPGTTATQAVEAMLARFNTAWTPQLRMAAAAEGLDTAQAVTLASIVQREVARPTEMRTVAGIYLRRLQEKMPLDADPTVLYALGILGQSTPLDGAQLAVDSPYNTYRHLGLPPGPICNPGLAALEAVTEPTPGQALYFLTTPAGRLVVADNLQQQLANRKKYLGY